MASAAAQYGYRDGYGYRKTAVATVNGGPSKEPGERGPEAVEAGNKC